MIKKTTEDGWDCVPELKEVVSKLEEISSYVYEINNCVRATDLDDMVMIMKENLEEAIETLENIDVDVEFETIEQ